MAINLKLCAAISAAVAATPAMAIDAYFKREYMRTDMPGVKICVYMLGVDEYEIPKPISSLCPLSIRVQ